jgi:hypothetical protein
MIFGIAVSFIPFDSPFDEFVKALSAIARHKRRVTAAGNVRILLLGAMDSAHATRATWPIATGTLSFPAFRAN